MNTTHTGDPVTGPEATYLAGLAQGRWRIQRCCACEHSVFPPRQFCPSCTGPLEWQVPCPHGTVYSTTVVRLDPKQPYNVSLIDLDAGVRMMSNVIDMDPDRVHIGMRVTAFIEESDEQTRVLFRPAQEVHHDE